jgi:hypothetical protein
MPTSSLSDAVFLLLLVFGAMISAVTLAWAWRWPTEPKQRQSEDSSTINT